MKKTLAVIALTLFLFSYLALAQETSPTPEVTAVTEAQVEAQADADLPTTGISKPKLHSLFIAATQGVAVDSGDASNFVLARATVGRVVLTKRLAESDEENADNEARCNDNGRCWTVRRTGVLAVTSKEESTRYHLRNIVVGEGTVSAELFKKNESVGSVSVSLVTMAGDQDVWQGKLTLAGKEWNLYLPFKGHRKLVRPAVVRKAMDIAHRCGITAPLAASEIRECVQNGGKVTVKQMEGCPKLECARPAVTVRELSASIKAKCEARGGTLVRKPVHKGRMAAGFRVVCVVDGEVVEESGSTEGEASSPTPTPQASASPSPSVEASATPTATATVEASATPSPTVTA